MSRNEELWIPIRRFVVFRVALALSDIPYTHLSYFFGFSHSLQEQSVYLPDSYSVLEAEKTSGMIF